MNMHVNNNIQGKLMLNSVHEEIQDMKLKRQSKKHHLLLFCTYILLGGLMVIGHFFAYVAHFIFLRDFWIRIQSAVVTSMARYQLSHPSPKGSHPSPYLASHPFT